MPSIQTTHQQATTEALQRLALSTVTPGRVTPPATDKEIVHLGVAVNGRPVLFTGPADCEAAREEAYRYLDSQAFKAALGRIGEHGLLSVTEVDGKTFDWPSECVCTIRKASGEVVPENSPDIESFLNIVLSRNPIALAFLLSTDPELEAIPQE